MNTIEEFKNFKQVEDKNNPFCILHYLDNGNSFYLEPIFITQLMGVKEQFALRYGEVISKMIDLVNRNKKVVFTGCFDNPLTDIDGYIFLEITDILDLLKIYPEDKSRGSDYGD